MVLAKILIVSAEKRLAEASGVKEGRRKKLEQ